VDLDVILPQGVPSFAFKFLPQIKELKRFCSFWLKFHADFTDLSRSFL
jgi:hypothetical protein